MHSGSALALSLPWDRAKGVVRSRTLGACNLSRCFLRYRARRNSPSRAGWGWVFFVGCGGLHCFFAPPCSAWRVLFCSCLRWKALFRPVVFTCTLCVAFVDSLVSRVGSSLASSTFVPGGWVVLSSCYMRNCFIAGFCDSGLQFCTAFRTRLRRVVATASSFVLDSVVSSWHKLLFHF